MSRIIVIGGGAAGMMAAIAAAEKNEVVLIEKNEKLGKKLYITGKGRCNITNFCDRQDFFDNIVRNGKFMFSSFDGFSNYDMYSSLEEWGLSLKIERGQRVFPNSDKSSDVIKTLAERLKALGVDIIYNTRAKRILTEERDRAVCAIGVETDKKTYYGDSIIIATGGLSYPSTGSDGDGYRMLKELGHRITPLSPSLVGMTVSEDFVAELSGISLKNIEISLEILESGKKKKNYKEFGEMLFTHKGVSGPLILTLSAYLTKEKDWPKTLYVDLKPAVSAEMLDKRILGLIDEGRQKHLKSAISSVLPVKLLAVILQLSGIDGDKKACDITRTEREKLVNTIKGMPLTLTGLCGYNEAVVTAGGVDISQINPKTMESRLVKGLFVAGEMLDVDAFTGGFNLQIAWSTGHAAGIFSGEV